MCWERTDFIYLIKNDPVHSERKPGPIWGRGEWFNPISPKIQLLRFSVSYWYIVWQLGGSAPGITTENVAHKSESHQESSKHHLYWIGGIPEHEITRRRYRRKLVILRSEIDTQNLLGNHENDIWHIRNYLESIKWHVHKYGISFKLSSETALKKSVALLPA